MDVSFVFPCLNEVEHLGGCLTEAKQALGFRKELDWELLVADNGSDDGSVEVALQHGGVRVVSVQPRGYGAALRGGISAAQGEWVIFADADGTYPYERALELLELAEPEKASMVLGSRIVAGERSTAMPWLHRYVGTPVLTWLINFLYGSRLTDCNAGFRCVHRETFLSWDTRTTGMEFASEMLVKALKQDGGSVREIPMGLRAQKSSQRVPHLRTWRDGTRHVLLILSEKPQTIEALGLFMAAGASILQVLAMAVPSIELGPAEIMGYHSQILFLMCGFLGAQIYLFGCMLYEVKDTPRFRVTRALLALKESSASPSSNNCWLAYSCELLGAVSSVGRRRLSRFGGFEGAHWHGSRSRNGNDARSWSARFTHVAPAEH